ncbi:MAG: hypothetical protein ABH811_00700 [archaeon]
MPTQDTLQTKERILSILRRRGPSLPVHIAGETGLSILFASAFLSELISERKVTTSSMKVGSSPIYFIPEQKYQLEKFAHHLKSKEKDAFILLKDKKFLKDNEQDPAIRVALRAIKDFAISFERDNRLIWRYFKIQESEFQEKEIPKKEEQIKEETTSQIEHIPNTIIEKLADNPQEILEPDTKQPVTPGNTKKEKPKELKIFEKPKKTKRIKKKTAPQKKNDKFFNKVKEFLLKKQIEIIDIENFNKDDLVLKVKVQEKEELLIAYNKKRVNEEDLIKANKIASDSNLSYIILSLGEPLKKLNNLIEAIKKLDKIEKLET